MTAPAADLSADLPPLDHEPEGRSRKAPLRSRVLSIADLDSLPDPQPLIHDTIDLGTVALLAGPSQSLKSFIALDWSACIATGKAWQGRPTTQQRVLYIAGEGAYGIKKRLHAWQTAWRTKIPRDTFSLLTTPVPLLSRVDVLELCGVVSLDQYGFIVIDTLSKSIAGADENSAKDMSSAVEALYAIQGATPGGTVLVVHHTGKDKTTIRGSYALEAGVDTVYKTEGTSEAVTLRREKAKDRAVHDVYELAFNPTAGTDSGTVSRRTGVGSSKSVEDLISHITSHYVGVTFSRPQLVATSGLSSSTIYRAVSDLQKQGRIVNVGTEQRPTYRLTDS